MKHKHWTVFAFDEMNKDGAYMFVVEVSIIHAVTETDAISQARRMVKRKNYHLRSVRECSSCSLQDIMGKFFKQETHDEEE